MDIRIGQLLIHDANQNNLYEPGLDTVTDPAGQFLPPKEQAVKLAGILKELHAYSWRGIFLSQASDYLEAFHTAEQDAAGGSVEAARYALQEAQRHSQRLPIKFDQQRHDQIMQLALKTAIREAFLQADRIAKAGGDIDEVQIALGDALNHGFEMDQVYHDPNAFDRNRADRILELAYLRGIPNLYHEAGQRAAAGEIGRTKYELGRIQKYIQEANQYFNLQLSYDQGRADKILKDAYVHGIPAEQMEADKLAHQGRVTRLKQELARLQQHILEANQSYQLGFPYHPSIADQMMAIALPKGAQDNFEIAKRFAPRGKWNLVKKNLDEAKQFIDEYNQSYAPQLSSQPLIFNQALADDLLNCASGQGSSP